MLSAVLVGRGDRAIVLPNHLAQFKDFRMKSRHLMAFAALAFAAAAGAQQETNADHAAHHAASAASAATPTTDGEVRKVDRDAGKLTLRHGPIDNLGMPGMTMVFRVVDARMLDGLQAGDKVKFAAERINGAITVTAIEPAK